MFATRPCACGRDVGGVWMKRGRVHAASDFDRAFTPIDDPVYLEPRTFLATNLHYTKYPTDTVLGVLVGSRALAFPVKIMVRARPCSSPWAGTPHGCCRTPSTHPGLLYCRSTALAQGGE